MARQVKPKRPPKRVILFIVEGQSDKIALEMPMKTWLEEIDPTLKAEFLVAKTDVTSDWRNNPQNIEKKINTYYFEPFFEMTPGVMRKDIVEVVQICDLDGTFIPDEYCRAYDEEHYADDGYIYDPPYIYGKTADEVIARNHRKAKNIRHLLGLDFIKVETKTCPYSVFFFSSNIEHYIFDKLNVDESSKKVSLARKFADQCDDDPEWFIRRICQHSQALKGMTLEESWAYIMEGTNSVKRHTNFNLYLEHLLTRIQGES